MRRPAGMALFGMVWLLRVRSEMKRCAKCRREGLVQAERERQNELERTPASCSTFFTIDTPGVLPSTDTLISPERLAPTTYCEVHGFNPPKEDIQEFYELTLLDENKSVQEKTAETIRIANKWEANDGPITPSYTNNDLVVLAAFVAAASASGISTPLAAPVAVARTVVAEPYDPNPQYSYGYEVQDPLTGDSHGQVETRSGDVVQGSYALLDSDGTRRVVDYSADPINGFNAVVSKQPLAVPAIAKVATPIAAPVPVLRAAPLAPAPLALPAPVLRTAPAPVVAPAPILRAAPLAPAPILRTAPLARAPVALSAPLLRAAPLAPAPLLPAPLARTTIVQAAPIPSTVISGAPVLRAAPLQASTTIVSGSPVPLLRTAPLLRSAPLANVW